MEKCLFDYAKSARKEKLILIIPYILKGVSSI
jgi:hypothetical protein